MTSINKFNKNITSKIDEFVNSNSELTNNDIIENSIINLDNVKPNNESLENNLNNGEILLDTKDIINLDTQDIIKQKKQKSKPLENKQKNIKPKKLSTKGPIVKDSIVQESIVQESIVQESIVQESKKPKTRKKIQSKDESKDESKNMDISNLTVSKKLTKPKKDIIPKVPKITKVQKNKSKKSDISNQDNQDNEDIEDKLIGDKKIRSFKVKLPDKEEYEGRFTGLTPYQAANKALSKYFRECERIDEEIKFSICESTRKSKKTIYSYYGRRQKLDIPVTYKIKDGDTEREIVKNFKNTLKKIKKIDTKNEQLLINT